MRHIYSLACLFALTAVLHAGDAAPADKALLVVKLPASAALTIGTSSTMQTGPERWFLSPKLEPGKSYSYSLSATWTENGKVQQRTLTGEVSAGKRTVVDFNAPPPVEKIKPPREKTEADQGHELTIKWAKVRATEAELITAETMALRAEADWQRADALWRSRPPAIGPEDHAAAMLSWQKYAREEISKREAYKQARRDVGLAELPKSRTYEFTYAATIKDLPKDKIARIWLPLPINSREQRASVVSREISAKVGVEKLYHNGMFYLEAMGGEVRLTLVFKIRRLEVEAGIVGYAPPAQDENLKRYLQPDALVPLGGKSLALVKDKKLPADQLGEAKVFYDAINNHLRYSKEGVGWGRGDADWACDSKFGNCTDFHSMFIALARAEHIPAKFEIGFSLPEKRGVGSIGGYHCWAWFLPKDKGWFPVDISEADRHPALSAYYFGNLTENRVHFTTGRDLDLVPKQAGKPLNYFIYPYVEVDGEPLPPERVVCSFRYRDVPGDANGKKN